MISHLASQLAVHLPICIQSYDGAFGHFYYHEEMELLLL